LILAPASAGKAPPSSQMGALPHGAVAGLGPPRLLHHEGISSLAFSPEGRTVFASASLLRNGSPLAEQQAIRAWEVRTGKLVRQFGGPRWGVLSLAMSPDGRSLASVGGDGAVDVWDAATGKQRGRVRAPLEGNCVSGVAYSGDGKLLASCGLDVRVWDAATGRLLHVFGKEGMYHALTFAPDRKSLVTTTYADTKVSFWDAGSGKRLRRVEGPTTACPSFSAGGLLALGGEEGEAQLWRPGEAKPLRRVGSASDEVLYGPCVVALSRDGKLLAFGAERGGIRLWDVARGRELARLPGHAKAVTALAFSPDGATLASGGLDREVRLWDVPARRQRFPGDGHGGAIAALSFAPDGRTVATAGEDGSVRVWSARDGSQARLFKGHKGPVLSLTFLGRGERLASGGKDGTVRFWGPGGAKGPPALDVKRRVEVLAASRDGGLLMAGLAGGQRLAWRRRGESLEELPGKDRTWARALAASPDGTMLATVGTVNGKVAFSHSVQVFNAEDGRSRSELVYGRADDLGPVAFSPDGKLLAAVHLDGNDFPIVVASVTTKQAVAHLRGPARRLRAVAFSPDGRVLAAGGAEGVVFLWEVASGQEVGRFEGHLDEITGVAFAPGGRLLASVGRDGRGFLWDRTRLGGPSPSTLSRAELEACWQALSAKAGEAHRCLWRLVAHPEQAVPLLKKHLRPVSALTAAERAQLIDALADDRYEVRQQAGQKLSRLAGGAEEDLKKAAEGHASLEVRLRARRLLGQLTAPSPERLRESRAVAVLEYVGTPAARRLLRELARGEPKARLTEEAAAALARLAGG
jgi:WD40 repeat protein